MSYSQFTIEQIKSEFGILLSEKIGTFAKVPESQYSQFLSETLVDYKTSALYFCHNSQNTKYQLQ